jgi:hypothetical protein
LSRPISFAGISCPSESVTLISVEPSTTWLLVTMLPAPSMTIPEPVPALGPGMPGPGKSGCAFPKSKKKRRKAGGRASAKGSSPRPPPRSAIGGRPRSHVDAHHAAPTAFAVAAKALERFFATSGRSVRGVRAVAGAAGGAAASASAAARRDSPAFAAGVRPFCSHEPRQAGDADHPR